MLQMKGSGVQTLGGELDPRTGSCDTTRAGMLRLKIQHLTAEIKDPTCRSQDLLLLLLLLSRFSRVRLCATP